MIRAVIFDLDGTLVQTERLKARSYAEAAALLCPYDVEPEAVIEAFKDVVGLSRREVAEALIARFDLEAKAAARAEARGLGEPWEAFVDLRLERYEAMLADPEVLRSHRWPHTLALLERARAEGCATALATMSHREQVARVLRVLALEGAFDTVATRDDVARGKPDPEIYRLVLDRLGVRAPEALIVEDSPAGVRAALASGAEVVAVATPFTRAGLHALAELPESRIVDDPDRLMATVDGVFARSQTQAPTRR